MVPENENGVCKCGCGKPTLPAVKTSKARGLVKGQPANYLHGHTRKKTLFVAPVNEQERYPFGKGLCACGCGVATKISKITVPARGLVKGEPLRFLRGHNRSPGTYIAEALTKVQEKEKYPFGKGKCSCGCGEDTVIAARSMASYGHIKGEPLQRVRGHNSRKWPELPKPDDGYKRCTRCVKVKANSCFSPQKTTLSKLCAHCKQCMSKSSRKWSDKNYDKLYQKRRIGNLKKFGLTLQDYDNLLKSQNGVCAICGGLEPRFRKPGIRKHLSVDHCHATGVVRSLLCSQCNTAIGLLTENPKTAEAALAYILKHCPPVPTSKPE